MAARIACHLPRRAHAAPILEKLGLESLATRREDHMLKIIDSIIQNKCHPALTNTFTQDTDGRLANDATARIQIGGKRFSVVGKEVFNKKYFPD